MAPCSEAERRDFWEICEDRYQTRPMIPTSQLPVSKWHEQIGDPTLADGILRFALRGRSGHPGMPFGFPPEQRSPWPEWPQVMAPTPGFCRSSANVAF
jgi:hypothetical protein